jgi:hypothetical protein
VLAAFMHANGFALDLEIKPTPGADRHTGQVVGRAATRPRLTSRKRCYWTPSGTAGSTRPGNWTAPPSSPTTR